jgi:hypothetical protein
MKIARTEKNKQTKYRRRRKMDEGKYKEIQQIYLFIYGLFNHVISRFN